ncbi:MAG: hypothetical protein HFI86_02185 [Bacilli bacterium]|nr:hypothetical protein [Bacilli bacterium]
MDMSREPTQIWEEFEKGRQYLKTTKLLQEWEDCEKFYEGNHWPQATERTRNMPRPVINLCSMIADNKKAGILSGNIKILFSPSEMFGDSLSRAEEGANVFTKFTDNITKELKQNDLDDLAQDSAVQLGTYIYHYYWDTTISGGMQTPFVGGVRGEIIHPKNVIFSNPMERDEQKQKYIIIASAEPLESVKQIAKVNNIQEWNDIKGDNDLEEDETNTLTLCTVLTKYSRQNGKVVWEKSTKYHYLQKPTMWEPNKKNIKINDEIDEQEINEPDTVNNSSYFRKQLYPIIVGNHKNRKKSIYGIGEVKQAIPNNKAINFNLGMMLLSVQNTAWPKIIQKMNALAKQMITNEPGEILTDTTKGSGWGVKYMDSPGFNGQALTLTNTILDLTRTTTGSTEITNGEALGANMAASAIIALQNQAKKPIEMYQRKFYRTYEKIGKVLEQFFKYYYNDGRLFSYEDDGQRYITPLNGQNYQDIDFNLKVEVGAGGVYSESLSISLLDTLKNMEAIDVDEYIELYPDSIMTFKSKLKKMREHKLQEQALIQQQQILNNQIPIQSLNNKIITQ